MCQLSKPERRRLSSANDGSIAPVAAIVLLALCMTVGLSIDYSRNLAAKTKLQSAADAASLAAVASVAQSEGTEADLASAKAMAHRVYSERLKDEADQLQQTPSIELVQRDGSYTATVTFSVANQNVFGALFSQTSQSLNGTAVASQQSTFLDLHLVLDVSASMGLGASEDDQRRLFENTGCQFGCHVAESGTSNEQNAINLGIPMRIDVLRSATRQMMDDVEAHPARDNVRIALHAFHDTAEQILAPTNDLDQARLSVQQLRLGMGRARTGTSPGTGRTPDSGDTQPLVMAQYLESALHHQGHGMRGDPRKLVVIVTDGTESTWSPGLPGQLGCVVQCSRRCIPVEQIAFQVEVPGACDQFWSNFFLIDFGTASEVRQHCTLSVGCNENERMGGCFFWDCGWYCFEGDANAADVVHECSSVAVVRYGPDENRRSA